MDELLRWIRHLWTPESRDQVVINLIAAVILAAFSAVIGVVVRWLLRRRAPSVPQPTTPPPPAERPVPRPPHRLAVPFIPRHDWEGRDYIERLSQALGADGLVTLWGAGGTGKTTLAVEAAHCLCPAPFRGGVVYASADGRPDFGCVTLLDRVLSDLGREDARPLAPDHKADLVCHLLGEALPCLLLLDNFETIAREEQPAILQFLAQVPCPMLVTSREELPTGNNLRLGPMTPPEAEAFLGSLIEHSPERARLERADLQQVALVAERNPMLMRWVVRQVELAQRPADVFTELGHGHGEAAERIFGRSFGLLDADGQTALLALALFVPTASREALAAVCGFDQDKTRLADATKRLKQIDLLETDPAGERLSIVGLTRRLTQAHLHDDERAKGLRERFVAHFLAYAAAHAQPTPEDYVALETEHANLLAAMDQAYEQKEWQVFADIADSIAHVNGYLHVRGHWTLAIELNRRAAKAAQLLGHEQAYAVHLHRAAILGAKQGNLSEAADTYQQVLAIYRKLDDKLNIAVALHQLGMLAHDQGDYEQARRLYQESLETFEKLGAQYEQAAVLHNLAAIAQAQGDYEQARRLYQESLEIAKKLGDQAGIAKSLHQLGMIAHEQGDYEQARRLYQESLDTFKKLGAQYEQAAVLHNLAAIAQAQGDYEQARRLYQESLDIRKKLGDQAGIAASLHQLGMIVHEQGDYEQARRLYQESLDTFKKLGAQQEQAAVLHNLAAIAQAQGDYEQARRLYQESLEIAKKLGDQAGIARSLHQLGRLAEDEGNSAEARRLFQESLVIWEKLGSPDAQIARRSLERVEKGGNE